MSTFLDNRPAPSVIADFRNRLRVSAAREIDGVESILAWLENLRSGLDLQAELIPIKEVRAWTVDPETGNIAHESGEFFGISGVRTRAASLREVEEWDQPILTQKEGGVLALICRDMGGRLEFLLHAKAESGNIGGLQLAPSVQCTWSNMNRSHKGKSPILSEAVRGEMPGHLIYAAEHNEEGGRFWRKSNLNCVFECTDQDWLESRLNPYFIWATLGQIKDLALADNVLSPFVKAIIAPL